MAFSLWRAMLPIFLKSHALPRNTMQVWWSMKLTESVCLAAVAAEHAITSAWPTKSTLSWVHSPSHLLRLADSSQPIKRSPISCVTTHVPTYSQLLLHLLRQRLHSKLWKSCRLSPKGRINCGSSPTSPLTDSRKWDVRLETHPPQLSRSLSVTTSRHLQLPVTSWMKAYL